MTQKKHVFSKLFCKNENWTFLKCPKNVQKHFSQKSFENTNFVKSRMIRKNNHIQHGHKKQDETNENEDLEFVQTYQEFAEMMGVSQCPPEQLSHWVLRIIFNKEKMMNKNIYLADIQDVIQRNSIEEDIQCTFSDDNAKELMMRIRIREDSHDGDYLEFLQELEKILMGITIRGIPNVEQVEPLMRKKIVKHVNYDTYN